MSATTVHHCTCAVCRSAEPHPGQTLHRQINVFVSRLDEQQRRWFAAFEAQRLGYGGAQRLVEITGIDRHTILRGQRELAGGLADRPRQQVRRPGAGRPAREAQDPELKPALEALLGPDTARDPMGRRAKRKRRSLSQLSAALTAAGHSASRPTVARLLRELGYSPKANTRQSEARSSADRNKQFEHIADERARFEEAGEPIISADSKKKEPVGNYKNPGRTWQEPDAVLVHDWPADSVGQAIPYGIYELTRNHGYVVIGDCFDTPRFAVEAISDWWGDEGQRTFPAAEHLHVLADAGGSNSCRSCIWKAQLQEQLCDACGL